MSFKPKVALAQDFLVNLATLSASVQGKVLKWALRFQSEPAPQLAFVLVWAALRAALHDGNSKSRGDPGRGYRGASAPSVRAH